MTRHGDRIDALCINGSQDYDIDKGVIPWTDTAAGACDTGTEMETIDAR